MIDNDIDIKLKMLNEFEKEIVDTYKQYEDTKISSKKCSNILNSLKGVWSCCRLDLKNYGSTDNSIEFINYPEDLKIFFPEWFKNNQGTGCKIEDEIKKINLNLKCVGNGKLKIILRGTDFRNIDDFSIRDPIYINYEKFIVNDEVLIDSNTLLWHNDFYEFKKVCKDEEIIKINLEYKTIFDYYPTLKEYLSNLNENTVNKTINNLLNYIKYEKMMIRTYEFEDNSNELYEFIDKEKLAMNENFKDILKDYNSFFNLQQNYNSFVKLNKSIDELNYKIDNLDKKFEDMLEKHDTYLSSNNDLFNTIFLDYELKPNRLLQNLQGLCSELLLFISNICEKHNIEWWLDYGNLLGAVRHQNFIPWDDDMDIGMMRKEYHHFIDVMYDEIKNHNLDDCINVYYRSRMWDNKKINSFVQLFVMNKEVGDYVMAGIDVFPYDFLSTYEDRDSFGINYNRAQANFYKKLYTGSQRSKLYMGIEYDKVITPYHSELNLSYDKEKYVIPGVEGAFGYGRNLYELMILESDKIFPLTKIKFGQHSYPAPHDYNYYLTNVYGNFMSVPKSIRTHRRVNNFRKMNNINEIFEEHIQKFKEVNNNF